MTILLEEKDPLDTTKAILEDVKEKTASLTVITLNDVPSGLLSTTSGHSTHDKLSPSINLDIKTSEPKRVEAEQNRRKTTILEQRHWNVKIINLTPYISENQNVIRSDSFQFHLKQHDQELAKLYLQFLQKNKDDENIVMGIILERQITLEYIHLTIELPLQGESTRIDLKKSLLDEKELQLLSQSSMGTLIAMTKKKIGNDITITIMKPAATKDTSNSCRENATHSHEQTDFPQSPRFNKYLVIVGIPYLENIFKATFTKQFFKFIEGQINIQYLDDRQKAAMITNQDVVAILILTGMEQKDRWKHSSTSDTRMMQQQNANTFLDKLSTSQASETTTFIFQAIDPFWQPNLIPNPPFQPNPAKKMTKTIKMMSTPGLLEISDNSASKNPLQVLSYLEKIPVSTPTMIQHALELQHLHVFSPKIIHLPPKKHDMCLLYQKPDVIIHNLGTVPRMTKLDETSIIDVARTETLFLINLDSKQVHHASFIEKEQKNE